MKLIKKVEINYLRSLYSATLDDIKDLNIVFGRNDSGKSNFLRALSLFFNDEIEPGRWVEFDLDMSDHRKKEARDAKGRQFIWIKITFNVPDNYKAALGEEISIKRQWNRDGGMTQTVFPNIGGAGKHARLTRFLNDIDFTYIPAIKDLNVYADLIERMYGAAAETSELRDATNTFVNAIGAQTTSLAVQLEELFGGPARLAPPTEMSQLFRSLDFSHGEDGHSLLRQKGDGIKARHLPELLRFINKNDSRKKIYLWGFEEPENSLDLSAAEMEAKRFASFADRQDTQVFITSHSPAFYLLDCNCNAEVRRFFITKQVKNEENQMIPNNAASLIDRIEDAEAKMERAGLLQLPFVIRQMGEQRRVLKEKEIEAEALRAELAALKKPTLFVEGKHDVDMFSAAFVRLGVEDEISIKSLGGTPQSTDALFDAVFEQGGISSDMSAFFLFDDDKSGRGAFRKLCKSGPGTEPTRYQKNTYAWVLQWTDMFKKFTNRHNISKEQVFFTAEFLFPADAAAKICLEIVQNKNDEDINNWKETISGNYWPNLGQIKCDKLKSAVPGTPDWYYARGVPESLKSEFSKKARSRSLSTKSVDDIAKKIVDSFLI